MNINQPFSQFLCFTHLDKLITGTSVSYKCRQAAHLYCQFLSLFYHDLLGSVFVLGKFRMQRFTF